MLVPTTIAALLPILIMVNDKATNRDFPVASIALESFGLKFTPGGPHVSRTMMLTELGAVLTSVPQGSAVADYRAAILVRNVLGKATDSTRVESLRRLRELYALDEAKPIFGLLIKLYAIDPASLPLLALQVAFGRDPTFRATAPAVIDAAYGSRVETVRLTQAFADKFPNQNSALTQGQTGRHAASSWTQSGHLLGRTKRQDKKLNQHRQRSQWLYSSAIFPAITGQQYFPIRGAGSLIWMLTVQRDSVRKLIVLAFSI